MKPIMTNFEGLLKETSSMRNILARLLSRRLPNHDFSPNELNMLIFLSNNPTINTAKELVLYLGVSKTLVCRSVDRLVEKKLLIVQEDHIDRRMLRLSLSEDANPIIVQLHKIQSDIAQKVMMDIKLQDIEASERVFATIKKNVKKLEDECS